VLGSCRSLLSLPAKASSVIFEARGNVRNEVNPHDLECHTQRGKEAISYLAWSLSSGSISKSF
jgi:hypothetical protein